MAHPVSHRVCRLLAACLLLAGLAGRTPGKACCGEVVAAKARPAEMQTAPAGGACRHCAGDASADPCLTHEARHSHAGDSDDEQPCRRGACTAVCCHLNALTTSPPAVATLSAVPLQLTV